MPIPRNCVPLPLPFPVPDARDRLAYIATLTEKAAERVLNATDVAKPLQDQMDAGAAKLSGEWDRLLKNELSIDDFKQLVTDTRGFLGTVSQHTKSTNDQLLEIIQNKQQLFFSQIILQLLLGWDGGIKGKIQCGGDGADHGVKRIH